jgi:hypothetical protein
MVTGILFGCLERPTFEEIHAQLRWEGFGCSEIKPGLMRRVEARNGAIVVFTAPGRITIHKDCWGHAITCRGKYVGSYNGSYTIYDWFRESGRYHTS